MRFNCTAVSVISLPIRNHISYDYRRHPMAGGSSPPFHSVGALRGLPYGHVAVLPNSSQFPLVCIGWDEGVWPVPVGPVSRATTPAMLSLAIEGMQQAMATTPHDPWRGCQWRGREPELTRSQPFLIAGLPNIRPFLIAGLSS